MSTSHGSSTGAAGVPTGLHDTRNEYNPSTSGFNSATGAGYEKPQETQAHTAPSNSYDNNDGVRTNKVHHPPPISQRAQGDVTGNTAGTTATGSRSAQAGESLGKGVKGFAAGLHVSYNHLEIYIASGYPYSPDMS